MKFHFNICFGLIAIATSCSLSVAQPTSAPATQPDLDKYIVHASAATRPWTENRLMLTTTDQQDGNAVPFYLMAPTSFPDEKTTRAVLDPENGKYNYLDTPIEQFPQQYGEALLSAYDTALHYADLGASRRDARWDSIWSVDWDDSPFAAHRFQYINGLRHVQNLLGFRARFEIHQHRWGAAQHTIQTMMALAQHIGSERVTVHELVATGFSELVLVRAILPWMSEEHSANLYWSLSVLPHPLISMNASDFDEDRATRLWRPLQAQAIKGTLPADQWNQALYDMVTSLEEARGADGHDSDKSRRLAEVDRLVKLRLDASRAALRAGGMNDATLEAMSPQQIVGMQWVNEYRIASAGVSKSFALPFPQAMEQMLQAWKEIAPQQSPAADNPLIQANLVASGKPVSYRAPTVLNRRYQMERTDRLVALLRCIEALRDYAASHDGRPPERLEDVTHLPVPVDPMTGRNFSYTAHGQVVTLDATPPAFFSPFGGWRLELTFVK